MADVFNKNPSEYVDMNEFFPILNDKVGLTYEQWRKLVENVNYIKNNSNNIKELVGTNSKPINFAYDMEVGKLYNCKGLVYFNSSSIYDLSSHIDSQDGFVLIYKPSLENVISVLDGHVWIFDSNGNILKQSGIKIFSINNRDEGFFSLYTPETSGLQGQILQSNGNDSAPTWLSIGNGLSIENGTLKTSGGSGGNNKLYMHNMTVANVKFILYSSQSEVYTTTTLANYLSEHNIYLPCTNLNTVGKVMRLNLTGTPFKTLAITYMDINFVNQTCDWGQTATADALTDIVIEL